MGRALMLETTFLIDLDREERRGTTGPAIGFLERESDARLYVSSIVAGEMASGPTSRDREKWEAFLAPLFVLAPTPDICWQYGRIYRHLRDSCQLIGSNDLWIAATAVVHNMPLVTRNRSHFARVPDLAIESY
ncbi:MAG: type II toxin-antitoxin system VapC family toxin [Vicinamibacterales bacterium]